MEGSGSARLSGRVHSVALLLLGSRITWWPRDPRHPSGLSPPPRALCRSRNAEASAPSHEPPSAPGGHHRHLCRSRWHVESAQRRSTTGRGVSERRSALWSSPLRWSHGLRTSPRHDPHTLGSRPTDFGADLARAIDGLQRLGAARPDTPLEPAHGFFGSMSVRDWQRWAWKHTEHHLRQFRR